MAEETLKAKTSKGLFWGGMSNFFQQLLGALFGIYLARTLLPDDYGLVGMLAIFTSLSMLLQESGFPSALMNRKEIRHDDYNAVFWFNIIVAVSIYLILYFGAPAIARYFHHPELVKLSRWLFLGQIISGFSVSQRAYLNKNLKIKEMAITNIVAMAISGTLGVYLAWKGYAYWALVIQALAQGVLVNIGYWFFSDWHPTFHVNFRPIKEMFPFSAKLLITGVLGSISGNYVSVILGRYYPAKQVGYYSNANKWSAMGSSVLTGMINSVALPVLATVVDERERQLRVLRKMVRFSAFISFPAMFTLAFIAPEFIIGLLTEKWAGSVLLMQIICIGAAFSPISGIFTNQILSRGQSTAFMWCQIVYLVLMLGLLFLLYPKGVTMMVIGITTLSVVWLIIWYILVWRNIGYKLVQLIADVLPFLAITIVSIIISWFITRWISNMYILMVAKAVVVAVLYILLMSLTQSVTFKESIQFITKLTVNE